MERKGGACPHQKRLPALVNSSLSADEATALQAHLSHCAACQKDEAAYRLIAQTLRRLPPLAAPPGLRQRVLAAQAPADTLLTGVTGATHRSLFPIRGVWRLVLALHLVIAVGLGVHFHLTRYRGRTPQTWLQAAREAADRSYSLHVVGWVRSPRGVIPVEGWRRAGGLTIRIGTGPPVRRADEGRPRALLATWGGEAGRFYFGEPLLFAIEREPPVTGPPRFHSRRPLVIAFSRAGNLEQRVQIDPDSEQVQRVQLIGPDGQPCAALERLEYGRPPFSGVPASPVPATN